MASTTTATMAETNQNGLKKSDLGVSLPEKIMLGFAFTFYVFWSFGHGSAYFMHDLAWIYEDFKQTLFQETAAPSIATYFYTCCLEPVYSQRLDSLRTHIAICATTGVLMLVQLSPQIRTKHYGLHRFLGGLSNTLTSLFIIQMGYILFYRGLGDLPTIIWWFDVAAFVCIVFGLVSGMTAILKYRNVKIHRAMMILCSAGMWMNASQRFFWALLSKTNSTMKTPQDWVDGPLMQSSVIAIALNLSVALYYGFATEMNASDAKRANALRIMKKVE
jgi:hypothetical protein